MLLKFLSWFAAPAALATLAVSAAHPQPAPPLDVWFDGSLDRGDAQRQSTVGDQVAYDCFVFDTVEGAQYSAEIKPVDPAMGVEIAWGEGRNCRRDTRAEDNNFQGDAWIGFAGPGGRVFIRAGGLNDDDAGAYRLIVRSDAHAVTFDSGGHASPETLRRWHRDQHPPAERLFAARAQLTAGGETSVMAELALDHMRGRGTTPDVAVGEALLLAAAEAGEAQGEYFLGYLHETGEGFEQDDAQAAYWYRRASQRSGDFAMTATEALGFLHFHGRGVAQDYAAAARLYQEAAMSRPSAQRRLAFMYAEGQGVPQDGDEFLRRLHLAIEAGDPVAAWALANDYAGSTNAAGLTPDDASALMWLYVAVHSGLSGEVNDAFRAQVNTFAETLLARFDDAGRARVAALASRCIAAGRTGCDLGAAGPVQTLRDNARIEGRLTLGDRTDAGGQPYDCHQLSLAHHRDHSIQVYSDDFDTVVETATSCTGPAILTNDDAETGSRWRGSTHSRLQVHSTGPIYARVRAATASGLGDYSISTEPVRWQGVAFSRTSNLYVVVADAVTADAARRSLTAQCNQSGEACAPPDIVADQCMSIALELTGNRRNVSPSTASSAEIDAQRMCIGLSGCVTHWVCPSET